MMFWPNPFGEKLQWSYSGDRLVDELILEVADVTGRILKLERIAQVYPGMSAEVNTADIPKGLYIISMKSNAIPILRKKMLKY